MAGLDPGTTRRPIAASPHIGVWASGIGAEPAAAACYDQGVAYLASFEWLLAARSFNEALRHDPNLALAELGLARAHLGLE